MDVDAEIGNRISDLLTQKGLRQKDLVDAGCAKKAHISHIINGTSGVSMELLFSICNCLGVTLSDFFKPFSNKQGLPQYLEAFFASMSDLREDEIEPLLAMAAWMRKHRTPLDNSTSGASRPHYRPLVGDAAAGPPLYSPASWADEEIEVPEKYADEKRFFPIRARGDSMEPKIHLGDVVIVQRDTPPDDGQIALVRLAGLADDEYTIKRVYYRNGDVILRSYNPAYPPMTYAVADVRSCDKVVHILRNKKGAPAQ